MLIVLDVIVLIFSILVAITTILLGLHFRKEQREKRKWLKLLDGKRLGLVGVAFVFVIITSSAMFFRKVLDPYPEVVQNLAKHLQIKRISSRIEEELGSQRYAPPSPAKDLADKIPDDAEPYALALKAVAQSRFNEARNHLGRAKKESEAELSDIYVASGQNETYSGNYFAAVKSYRDAIDLVPNDLDVLDQMVVALYDVDRYFEAETLAYRIVKSRELFASKNDLDLALSWNNLGLILFAQEKYVGADSLFRLSLRVREIKLGRDHPDVSLSLNNLGETLDAQGKYGEAEPLLRRALKIREEKLGPDHFDVSVSLNNLGETLDAQGKYGEAEPLLRRALKITENKLGPDHPSVAIRLSNLALLLKRQGKYSEAEPLYRRALRLAEKILGPDHSSVAFVADGLAVVLHKRGKYAEAEPLFRRAVEIGEKKLGFSHPDVATWYSNLAGMLRDQRKYSEAELLLRRALKIREEKLGPDHQLTKNAHRDLQQLLDLMKSDD